MKDKVFIVKITDCPELDEWELARSIENSIDELIKSKDTLIDIHWMGTIELMNIC